MCMGIYMGRAISPSPVGVVLWPEVDESVRNTFRIVGKRVETANDRHLSLGGI